MIYLLLTLLLLPAVAHADEKVVAVPRDQFVKVLAEVQQNRAAPDRVRKVVG